MATISQAIQKVTGGLVPARIVATGYAEGGALAKVAAAWAAASYPSAHIRLITFGAPYVGDARWLPNFCHCYCQFSAPFYCTLKYRTLLLMLPLSNGVFWHCRFVTLHSSILSSWIGVTARSCGSNESSIKIIKTITQAPLLRFDVTLVWVSRVSTGIAAVQSTSV